MHKEITLQLDWELYERVQSYADERGIPLSQIVAAQLQQVVGLHDSGKEHASWQTELLPVTQRLADRPPASAPIDEDDYYRYLERKHGNRDSDLSQDDGR